MPHIPTFTVDINIKEIYCRFWFGIKESTSNANMRIFEMKMDQIVPFLSTTVPNRGTATNPKFHIQKKAEA